MIPAAGFSPPNEIDAGGYTEAVMFSANGKYLLSGGEYGVQVWRVEDGQHITTLEAKDVRCLAGSRDDKWIAAGTLWGRVIVWNAETYEQVFEDSKDPEDIYGVDFSPDSTRLLSASRNGLATLWDIQAQKPTETLHHKYWVRAAKYSPQGSHIATATSYSVHVWSSHDGSLLVDIPITVAPRRNKGLLWFDNDLLVVSHHTVRKFNISNRTVVGEWRIVDNDDRGDEPCIALPQHGEFIVCAVGPVVTVWDTSTNTQLGRIQHPQKISCIALSLDDEFLAVCGVHGNITIRDLHDDLCPSRSSTPFIHIANATRNSWKEGRLTDAEILLTQMISDPMQRSHHALANRALVRSRLRHWVLAVQDAESSINIQPSVIGYIAKSVALIGSGKKEEGCLVFDLAFEHCDPVYADHLCLIKAVVLFIAGNRNEAVAHVGDLIDTVWPNSMYQIVLAHMYLLLGNSHVESGDYDGALYSFEEAQAQMPHRARYPLLVSLISGWTFCDLSVTIRQRRCEAQFAADRAKDAGELLFELANTFDNEAYANGPLNRWICDFARHCLSVPKIDETASKEGANHDQESPCLAPDPSIYAPFLTEWVKATLVNCSWKDALVTAADFIVPKITVHRTICERLESMNHITDAIECLHKLIDETRKTVAQDRQTQWTINFRHWCAEKLECFGDRAADTQQHNDAITHYSAALSIRPADPKSILAKRSKEYTARGLWEEALDDTSKLMTLDPSSEWNHMTVLIEWGKVSLTDGSWKEALETAHSFKVPRSTIYSALYQCLEILDRIVDTVECFREMEKEVRATSHVWAHDFKSYFSGRLVDDGDSAMDAKQCSDAISRYSAALSLNPATPGLTLKRCMAYTAAELWEEALNDAEKVIELDPLSPFGYERRHAVLHRAGDYENAIDAFEMMLSIMLQSSDPGIRECYHQYISPEEIRTAIRGTVQDIIHDSPRVLINTVSGRLLDKFEQATAFELLPVCNELISSMTTYIDHARIQHDVTQYYRYAMFSHKWEDNEPLFDDVVHAVVYELEKSPTNDKLRSFCEVARDAGLHWAWSDTCCINKTDHFVLQEALVSMFKWYQGSSLTVIYLCDVPWRRLVDSIWNSRSWTFQEYHASKVVRFYNSDWTPYWDLGISNHKESLEVILEMEEVTGISAQALVALRPGLDDIREKLSLASTRQTSLVEDAAYSLLGIFSMSLPIVYGDGDQALGKLLAQLLPSSGDTSILAWSGKSGNFNSCLPSSITVFKELPTSHVPPTLTDVQMDVIITGFRISSFNLTSLTKFHDRLLELSVPSFMGKRMKLPGIVFKLGPLSASRSRSERTFHAQTDARVIVEIKTKEDLSRFKSLHVVHPWIDFLLDRQPGSVTEATLEDDMVDQSFAVEESLFDPFPSPTLAGSQFRSSTVGFASRFGSLFGRTAARHRDALSLRPPSTLEQKDKQMLALQMLARLRQPFGALLLTPNYGNGAAFRRVAAENVVTVQIGEITSTALDKLIESVRILDVL